MSTWFEVEEDDDIEIVGDDVHILYDDDNFGNKYVVIKKKLLEKKLKSHNKDYMKIHRIMDSIQVSLLEPHLVTKYLAEIHEILYESTYNPKR